MHVYSCQNVKPHFIIVEASDLDAVTGVNEYIFIYTLRIIFIGTVSNDPDKIIKLQQEIIICTVDFEIKC